jgi:hypothetical protein
MIQEQRKSANVIQESSLKKAVFWDVAPCRSGVNRRFGGTYRLHLQGRAENKKIRTRSVRQRRPTTVHSTCCIYSCNCTAMYLKCNLNASGPIQTTFMSLHYSAFQVLYSLLFLQDNTIYSKFYTHCGTFHVLHLFLSWHFRSCPLSRYGILQMLLQFFVASLGIFKILISFLSGTTVHSKLCIHTIISCLQCPCCGDKVLVTIVSLVKIAPCISCCIPRLYSQIFGNVP